MFIEEIYDPGVSIDYDLRIVYDSPDLLDCDYEIDSS